MLMIPHGLNRTPLINGYCVSTRTEGEPGVQYVSGMQTYPITNGERK